MKVTKIMFGVLLLAETLGAGAASAGEGGVLAKAQAVPGNYCHMKFPAIREETLSWDRPVLKDPGSGDIIDFYGPCNHDPLGNEEIQRQRADLRRRFAREYAD